MPLFNHPDDDDDAEDDDDDDDEEEDDDKEMAVEDEDAKDTAGPSITIAGAPPVPAPALALALLMLVAAVGRRIAEHVAVARRAAAAFVFHKNNNKEMINKKE